MKKLLITFVVTLFANTAAYANIITFSESMNTADYTAYGLTLSDSGIYGPDARIVDDGFGLYNRGKGTGIIEFDTTVEAIDFTWATQKGGVDFYADAYDSLNNLVDQFFFNGSATTASANGSGSLFGKGIVRLEFHDSEINYVAIDTLNFRKSGEQHAALRYKVPEPGTLALLGFGLISMGFARRKKKHS